MTKRSDQGSSSEARPQEVPQQNHRDHANSAGKPFVCNGFSATTFRTIDDRKYQRSFIDRLSRTAAGHGGPPCRNQERALGLAWNYGRDLRR